MVQLETLAGQQRQLAEAAQSLSEKVATLRVSCWLLKKTAREMRRVADLLQQGGAGAATQESQQVVRAQLSRLLQIWQADAPVNSATSESVQPQDQDPPWSTDAVRDGMSLPPAEIQLLVFLQRDLNQRTRRLSNQREPGKEPTEQTKRLLGELAQQQGQLANLLEQLLSSAGPEEVRPSR
jgi:hypothetical protein